jgi:hypothetical protein
MLVRRRRCLVRAAQVANKLVEERHRESSLCDNVCCHQKVRLLVGRPEGTEWNVQSRLQHFAPHDEIESDKWHHVICRQDIPSLPESNKVIESECLECQVVLQQIERFSGRQYVPHNNMRVQVESDTLCRDGSVRGVTETQLDKRQPGPRVFQIRDWPRHRPAAQPRDHVSNDLIQVPPLLHIDPICLLVVFVHPGISVRGDEMAGEIGSA